MAFCINTSKFVIVSKIQFLTSLYSIINGYAKRFSFPHRGWKYVRHLLIRFGLLNRFYTKKLHNGFYFLVNPADHIQAQLFWYGYYEKEAIRTWEQLIRPGFIVADIGANTGYYSVVAAQKAKQVFAFEPSGELQPLLKKNLAINQLKNVTVLPFALGNANTSAELWISNQDNTGMTSLTRPENFSGKKEIVAVRRFDDWINEQAPDTIHLIKIDTEGAEMAVLEGMAKTLRLYKPVVFIEVMDELLVKTGHKKEDIFLFFNQLGYDAYRIQAPGKLIRLQKPEESWVLVFIPSGSPCLADVTISAG